MIIAGVTIEIKPDAIVAPTVEVQEVVNPANN